VALGLLGSSFSSEAGFVFSGYHHIWGKPDLARIGIRATLGTGILAMGSYAWVANDFLRASRGQEPWAGDDVSVYFAVFFSAAAILDADQAPLEAFRALVEHSVPTTNEDVKKNLEEALHHAYLASEVVGDRNEPSRAVSLGREVLHRILAPIEDTLSEEDFRRIEKIFG
jgi:hypothetical protein